LATLSAVLIVKDEESNLPACLRSVAWADETVVVDAGSTDRTVEIARELGARTFVEADWQGYGIQRQRAQAQARGDWIFMIDADERVTEELRRSIERVVREDDRSRVYHVSRLSHCFGGFVRHGGWYPDRVVRLYPRDRAGYRDERVHERVHHGADLTEEILDGDLLHYTYRDLRHYLVKSAGYAADWAEERAAAGRRATLREGLFHAAACFVRMYGLKAGFLDGGAGLLLAVLSAHSTFVKYADLWVRNRQAESDDGGATSGGTAAD
jgi:(heptosyl)LPS beta-1,4-glucosyltransferase